MKKVIQTALTVFLGLALVTSCVSKKKMNELKESYQESLKAVNEREETVKKLTSQLEDLREKNDQLEQESGKYQQQLGNCLDRKQSSVINQLVDEIKSSDQYVKELVSANVLKDSINTALANKLKRSLNDVNDKDINVKVLKGVVFISLSDKMLYKSGSYELLPAANKVLAKVAKIINDYKNYDVLVEGHTDSKPILGNYKGLKDNWDLSALRATSVVRVLQQKFSVSPDRLTAGGRSQYSPKTSNSTEAGRSENRRTEIIILPKLDEFAQLLGK